MSYYKEKIKMIKKWAWLDTEDANFYYKLTPLNRDCLAQTISSITDIQYDQIQSYFEELENDQELKDHIKSGIMKAGYGKDLKVDYGRRLGWYAIVRAIKPKIVVETGVDHGVGSCVLTKAIKLNNLGYYYGTDINLNAGKLLYGEYSKHGKILYGDSILSLKQFEEKIDVFINDSDHSADYEYEEYLTIAAKLSHHSIILGDNSHVTDRLSLFSRETGRKFIFFSEKPDDHWYPGAGIGISYNKPSG